MTALEKLLADLRWHGPDGNLLDHVCLSRRMAQEIADTQSTLNDPTAVHINMLAGKIAKPTVEQLLHIYGREPLLAALAKFKEVSSE